MNEVLLELDKDLSNFKLNIDKKDKTIKEYIRLLALANKKYQKLFEENKQLKHQLLKTRKNYPQKKQIKRRYVIEQTDSEQSAGEELPEELEETIEEEPAEIKENKERNVKKTFQKKKLRNRQKKPPKIV